MSGRGLASVPVAVVGGGITGLSAALTLNRRLGGDGFLLLEGSDRLGGKIVTHRQDGLVIEGGPDCFLARKPGGLELCHTLGLDGELFGPNPAMPGSFVKRRGRLHPLPEGLSGLVPGRLGPLLRTGLLSPLGRLRACLEPLVPSGPDPDDTSVAAFVTRRFGREAYTWLVEPLLAGIFAGDGAHLSVAATFPQLAADVRVHGSILRAMLSRRMGGSPPVGPGFVTLPRGMGQLVEAAAAALPAASIRTGAAVTALEPRGTTGYRLVLADGDVVDAERVVLATPAWAGAELVRPLSASLADELAAIPHVSVATVSLAFPAAAGTRPLRGYGYLSPRAEGGPLVACSWTSNKFPDRVTGDRILLRVFVGRAGQEAVLAQDDDRLVDWIRVELEQLFGIRGAPEVARVFRWPRGMPQYHLGHVERLARIDRLLAEVPGVALAGAGYRGVGIPDCIAQGATAANRLLAGLPVPV